MNISTQILLYPQETLRQNLDAGTMAPFGPENLPTYIDCGDDRALTALSEASRLDIPARLYGGSTGFAATGLISIAMHYDNGGAQVAEIVNEYENGITGLAAELSTNAHDELAVELHQHSDDTTEGNAVALKESEAADLACAFATQVGGVVLLTTTPEVVRTGTDIVYYSSSLTARDVQDASNAAGLVLPAIGGSDAQVARAQLVAEKRKDHTHVPVAIVSGQHNQHAKVVFDLAGFKAKAGDNNYHHSPVLPELIIPRIFPGTNNVDPGAIRASSVLLGAATMHALGAREGRVIPERYAVV